MGWLYGSLGSACLPSMHEALDFILYQILCSSSVIMHVTGMSVIPALKRWKQEDQEVQGHPQLTYRGWKDGSEVNTNTSLFPTIDMVVHNCLQLQFQGI